MNQAILIGYVAGFVLSSIIIAGWVFAYNQDRWAILAAYERHKDFALSVFFGMWFSACWPLGLLLAYLLTEKAKYGWRRPTLRQI